MRALFAAVALVLFVGACGSSEPADDESRAPAPRVAPTTTDRAPGPVEAAPQPQPGKTKSRAAATTLCKALDAMGSEDDPEEYLAALEAEAAKAGFGFPRLVAVAQRALVDGQTRKAGDTFARLGTLCAEVVGRRNF